MRRALLTSLVLSLALAFNAPAAWAGAPGPSQELEIILDASGSMKGRIGGKTKMAIAKAALVDLVEGLKDRKEIALAVRVYGHQSPRQAKDCTDSRLELPFAAPDPQKVRGLIKRIKPQGYTPIAYSLLQAKDDFAGETPRPRAIVLITDGLETCDGDACAVARELMAAGLKVTLHVVGFDLKKEEMAALKCLTQPSGGLLLEARDAAGLAAAMEQAVKKAVAHNLEVRARTSAGAPRQAHFGVLGPDGKALAVAQGTHARFRLAPGTYTVQVRDWLTDQELSLAGVTVSDGAVTEKEVVLDSGDLVVLITDTQGQPRKGWAEIKRGDGEGHQGTYVTGGRQVFHVAPGTYDLEATVDKLGARFTRKGIAVAADETVEVKAPFGRARLSFKVTDAGGGPVKAYIDLWRLEDGSPQGNRSDTLAEGTGTWELVPGTYSFTAKDLASGAKVEVPAFELKDGQELGQNIVIK